MWIILILFEKLWKKYLAVVAMYLDHIKILISLKQCLV